VVGGFNGCSLATVGFCADDVDGSAVEARVSIVGDFVFGTLVPSACDALDFSFVVCVLFGVCDVCMSLLEFWSLLMVVWLLAFWSLALLVVGVFVVGDCDVGAFWGWCWCGTRRLFVRLEPSAFGDPSW